MWHSDSLGVIRTPKEITVNGVTHPRQIFRKWSKAQLAELGITPVRVETPDQRYHNTGAETLTLVDGETVISYATTEKDVEGLKTQGYYHASLLHSCRSSMRLSLQFHHQPLV